MSEFVRLEVSGPGLPAIKNIYDVIFTGGKKHFGMRLRHGERE